MKWQLSVFGVTEGSQTDLLKVLWSAVFLCGALSFDGDRTKSIPAEKALAEGLSES